jgi:hypothetical protein
MVMQVTLVILKTGEKLVSLTNELQYEPKVHLQSPYVLSGKAKVVLSPWPGHTDEKDFLLFSTDLLTACVPSQEIKDLYLKKVGVTEEDLTKTPEPVILNESTDEYEPSYEEIPPGLDQLY